AALGAHARSVEAKDLLERRRARVRDALLQERRHVVLPPPADIQRLHAAAGRIEVVRLEVAEDLVAGTEDRVVGDARGPHGVEQLGPDRPVGLQVVLHLLRPDSEDECGSLGHAGSLATRTTRLRGPCTPSTRLSSMSEVADGPEMNVIGRPSHPRRTASASGRTSTIWRSRTTQTWRSGTSVSARRPSWGWAVRMIVPVSATATVHPVSAPSTWSSSAAVRPRSSSSSTPDGLHAAGTPGATASRRAPVSSTHPATS